MTGTRRLKIARRNVAHFLKNWHPDARIAGELFITEQRALASQRASRETHLHNAREIGGVCVRRSTGLCKSSVRSTHLFKKT